ncbi:MAG: glycine oxidase ThiO [Chromatiales bacterium]|nr:glycine oxidase ThiO [Chromatiales bacterium]
MTSFDAVIVGGGVIGMLTARELLAAGLRVALVERGAPGRESTWAGGGILSPLHPWRYPDPVNQLAEWSKAAYPQLARELIRDTGVDPQWTPNGMLMLHVEDRHDALAWEDRFQAGLDEIEEARVLATEPALCPSPGPGLWMEKVGQVRNPRLARALRVDIELRGAVVLCNDPVTQIDSKAGRVSGVRTTNGQVLSANRVVIAAGAWTAELLAGLCPAPPVEPVRGQMLVYRTQPGTLQRIVLFRDRYLIPRRDGRIVAGSTMERVGFDKSTTADARAAIHADAAAVIPLLADAPIEHHWSGLRPGSPNGVPFIGEHPRLGGLYINAGHFRNGLVTAPASTRLLADLLLGREPILAPAAYSLR